MRTQPRPYQLEAFEFAKDREYFANLLPMGLGKTLVELMRIEYLRERGLVTGVLYICPKCIYSSVQEQFETHWSSAVHPIDIVFWTGALSLKHQAELRNALDPTGSLKVAVVNVEAFSHERVMKFVKAFAKAHNDPTRKVRSNNLCIVDESSRIKCQKANRTKRILQVAEWFNRRDIMTGTPVLNNPTDLWTQAKFLSPGALGEPSFIIFRRKYCQLEVRYTRVFDKDGRPVLDRNGHAQTRQFYKILGTRNISLLKDRLYRFAYRREKHEVLNLPDKVYTQREIEMTPEQRKLYLEVKREVVVKLRNKEISAQNAVVSMVRMQQLLCGYLPTTDKEVIEIHSYRLDELMSVLDELDGKVLIWCPWNYPRRQIRAKIAETYGENTVVQYDGETTVQERTTAINRLREDEEVRFFVSNPSVGGIGLNLTAATNTVYYMNRASLEERLQSEDRNHRLGTKGTVTVVDLVTKNTIDEKLLRLLKNKSDLATEVLGDTRKLLDFLEN